MNLRVRWILKHPAQAKYLLIVILAMLAPTLVIGVCFYHLVFSLLAQQMAFPEAIMANLAPVIERVNTFLILSLPIVALVILWIAIRISHRFAGPIDRLEEELDAILRGDLQHRVRLRKHDDLSRVGHKINQILDKIKESKS